MKTSWREITDKDQRRIRRSSIRATGMNVLDYLQHIPVETVDLVLDIRTGSVVGQAFIGELTNQLLSAYQSPRKFQDGLESFFDKWADELVTHHMVKDFLQLTSLAQRHLRVAIAYDSDLQAPENWLFSAYMSLLAELHTHLSYKVSRSSAFNICGVKDNEANAFYYCFDPDVTGSLLLDDYVQPDEVTRQRKPWNKMLKFDSYLSQHSHLDGHDVVRYMDQNNRTQNMFSSVSPFISPETVRLLTFYPYPFNRPFASPRSEKEWQPTSFYKDSLNQRRYVLPSSGIEAVFHNAGDIKAGFFQEIYCEDRIVLLYLLGIHITDKDSVIANPPFFCEKPALPAFRAAKNETGWVIGYYDTRYQYFYSPFNYNSDLIMSHIDKHLQLENFVLENYYRLALGLRDVERKKAQAIKVVPDVRQPGSHYVNQILASYKYMPQREGEPRVAFERDRSRFFDPAVYSERFSFIKPFIRRLPDGYNASKEAIDRARELGYVIHPGETFVRGFTKKTYRKEDEQPVN